MHYLDREITNLMVGVPLSIILHSKMNAFIQQNVCEQIFYIK